jgi:hypothetical protein
MSGLSILAVAALAAVQPAASPAPASETASLVFVAPYRTLSGSLYGFEGIDEAPRVYARRTSTEVVAGERTVWYACPGEAPMAGNTRLTFDFEPGHRYELVCQAGRAALIRQAEGC